MVHEDTVGVGWENADIAWHKRKTETENNYNGKHVLPYK